MSVFYSIKSCSLPPKNDSARGRITVEARCAFDYYSDCSVLRRSSLSSVLLLRFGYWWIPLWSRTPVSLYRTKLEYIVKICRNSMKPTRIRMCHSLVMNYGLYKKMEIFVRVEFHLRFVFNFLNQRAKPATKREMTQFHSDEYIEFLSRITPNNMNTQVKEQHKCSFGFMPV